MDPIEKAIRNAFEKGNADDPAFREKVYRSAAAALDRAMQAHPGLTLETAIIRRKNLQAKIANIESEFQPAVAAAAADPSVEPVVAAPRPPARTSPAPAPFVEPRVAPRAAAPAYEAPIADVPLDPVAETAQRPLAATEPRIDAVEPPGLSMNSAPPAPASLDIVPDPEERPSLAGEAPFASGTVPVHPASDRRSSAGRPPARRGRAFAKFLVTLLVLGGLAGATWFALERGFIRLPAEFGLAPAEPPVVSGDPPAGGPAAPSPDQPAEPEKSRNWINVFSPGDATAVTAPSGATAQVMQDESGSFLRITSGASGAAVVFDVGQGVLEQIAGKKAAFDLIARSEDGKETQISVDCDFGALGDCGRKRYTVGFERGEYLFDVELPAKAPTGAGSIRINSDFDNGGKAVDIYEIRVSPAP